MKVIASYVETFTWTVREAGSSELMSVSIYVKGASTIIMMDRVWMPVNIHTPTASGP
jgi:hypothetical protein